MAIASGKLARLAGVSPDTLRHYERVGVLQKPARSENNYRVYPESALPRVMLVRRALAFGFSLAELAIVLKDRERGAPPCRKVRALAAQKLASTEVRLLELTRLRDGPARKIPGTKKDSFGSRATLQTKGGATGGDNASFAAQAGKSGLITGSTRCEPAIQLPEDGTNRCVHGCPPCICHSPGLLWECQRTGPHAGAVARKLTAKARSFPDTLAPCSSGARKATTRRTSRSLPRPNTPRCRSRPELSRHTIDVKVSLHDMEDTYLKAFRQTLGKAYSVMCAYNLQVAAPRRVLVRGELRGCVSRSGGESYSTARRRPE